MQAIINRAKEFLDGKPETCLIIRNRLILRQKNP